MTGKYLDARGGDVGLADAQGLTRTTARAEGRHDVALNRARAAGCEGRGHVGVGGHEVEQVLAGIIFEVDAGDKVVVGGHPLQRRIVEQQPARPTDSHVKALQPGQ